MVKARQLERRLVRPRPSRSVPADKGLEQALGLLVGLLGDGRPQVGLEGRECVSVKRLEQMGAVRRDEDRLDVPLPEKRDHVIGLVGETVVHDEVRALPRHPEAPAPLFGLHDEDDRQPQ